MLELFLWSLAIGTILFPFIVLTYYLLAFPFDEERFHPSKIRRGHDTPAYPDLRKVADKQAKEAEKRHTSETGVRRSKEGTTRAEWCTDAALRLMALWPGISYDEALRWIWDELRGMGVKFGDPDYGWSLADARKFADEIASTYGEQYGSNA